MEMPNGYFKELASEDFAFLTTKFGMITSAWDVGPGISHIEYKGPRLTVRFSYEPFGPPWCDISDNEGQGLYHRLPVEVDDPTATELANMLGHFDAELMKRHHRAIAEWLSAARPVLEGWLDEHAEMAPHPA
ncbi:MAG: hypothetical protein JWM82_2938 [Myxococcales bacterium]|nr:hypothetical protein [Myxococcales bacterium]